MPDIYIGTRLKPIPPFVPDGSYRDEEQQVKTVNALVDNWYRAVGGNSVFLLNITPDRRGLIPEKDVSRLKEVGRIIGEALLRT